MYGPAIIVHGGAWYIPDNEIQAHIDGCEGAVALGFDLLERGGAALDAVVQAVAAMEDDPAFDAGRGAVLTREQHVELDAGVMEGNALMAGGVTLVNRIRNPVLAARKVMETGDYVLLGAGPADAFAEEQGLETADPEYFATERERDRYMKIKAVNDYELPEPFRGRSPLGTVGAVALDSRGGIAAATSTGGVPYRREGRIGDSAVPGAGFFADSGAGGASATGHGEGILRYGLSRAVVELMREGHPPQQAAERAIAAFHARVAGLGGLITLNRSGRPGAAFNTPRMARAWKTSTDTFSACDP